MPRIVFGTALMVVGTALLVMALSLPAMAARGTNITATSTGNVDDCDNSNYRRNNPVECKDQRQPILP